MPAPKQRATTATQQLIDQGRVLFHAGEVLRARQIFSSALTGRLPDVLHELARTYDPHYLQQLPKSDAKPNPSMARAIYQHAVMVGSAEAGADLARLRSQLH